MRTFAEQLLRHRASASLAFAVAIVAAAFSVTGLRFDFSLEPLFEADESSLREVVEFQQRIPPQFYDVIVTATWKDPIESEQLALVADAAGRVVAFPDVRHAWSLATTPVIPSNAGLPVPMPFPSTVGDRSVLETARQHPLLFGRLISRDGRSVALPVDFDLVLGEAPSEEQLERVVTAVKDAVGPGAVVRRIGGAVVERAMSTSMLRDAIRSLAIEAVVCLILLVLLFRTARGAAVPMVVVLAAQLLSMGLLVALGYRVFLIDLAIPGLVTIIGLCDAVHMMHGHEESLRRCGDPRAAIVDMMTRVGMACFYTSFTTGVGFLSLLVSDHPAVREFGLKASVAVAMTFCTVIVGLPLVLSFLPVPRSMAAMPDSDWRIGYGRPRLTLAIAATVTVLSLVGVSRVRVDSKWLEELPQDAPEVRDIAWFEDHFTGLLSIDVRVAGPLDRPDVFRAVEALQRRVLDFPDVVDVESYTAWVREALGNPDELSDDAIRRGVGWLRRSGPFFPEHVVDRELALARVTFRTPDIGTRRFLELADEVERLGADLAPQVEVSTAGYMRMAHESSRLVVTTMLRSFLVSLLVISVFISLVYRSVRLGVVSVVPNVLPILIALGINGWFDIPVRIGIVMIYSLGLGLAVDDTIHLVTRFFHERRIHRGEPVRASLQRAVRGTGRALVITSVILSAGCLCYLPSAFRSMIDVGILLNAVVVSALFADLFLLPFLLEWVCRGHPEVLHENATDETAARDA